MTISWLLQSTCFSFVLYINVLNWYVFFVSLLFGVHCKSGDAQNCPVVREVLGFSCIAIVIDSVFKTVRQTNHSLVTRYNK